MRNILLFLLILDVYHISISQTSVGGIIKTNTTWTANNSPYTLSSNVQISPNVTLTLEPGVVIIGNGYNLQTFGYFEAIGTKTDKISISNTNILTSGVSGTVASIKMDYCDVNGGSICKDNGNYFYGILILTNSVLNKLSNTSFILWYPIQDCFIERNIFIECGGFTTGINNSANFYIRNNIFYKQSSPYAVRNYMTFNSGRTIVKKNSFLSNDRIALEIPSGYSNWTPQIIADSNYWNTTNETVIQNMIADGNDDLNRSSIINYLPFLMVPDRFTPKLPELLPIPLAQISFGNTALGDSIRNSIYLKSGPISEVTVSSITNGNINFNVVTISPKIIPANDSVAIICSFKPTSFGPLTDTVKIISDGGMQKITMIGTSPYPTIIPSASSVSIDNVARNTSKSMTIKISNSSINTLIVDSVYTKTLIFKVNKSKLAVSSADSVTITFMANSIGTFKDTLYLRNNSATSLVTIPLSGNSPAAGISIAKMQIDYPAIAIKDSLSMSVMIKNISISDLTLNSISTGTSAFVAKLPTPTTIKGLDSVSVSVMFKPSAFSNITDTLTITSDGGNKKVVLTGSSPYPKISVIGNTDCGSIKKGQTITKFFKITNSSINQLVIDSMIIKSKVFAATGLTSPRMIRLSDSAEISVKFTPDSVRSFVDTMYVYNNMNVSPFKIIFTGVGTSTTGIARINDVIPTEFNLAQNYPNPFNPVTIITFVIPNRSVVKLGVFEVLGREIVELVDEERAPGTYQVKFDGSALSSGVYFYQLRAGNTIQTKKLFLMK